MPMGRAFLEQHQDRCARNPGNAQVPSPRTPSWSSSRSRSPVHPLPLDHRDPGQVTLIPLILFSRIGWIDTTTPPHRARGAAQRVRCVDQTVHGGFPTLTSSRRDRRGDAPTDLLADHAPLMQTRPHHARPILVHRPLEQLPGAADHLSTDTQFTVPLIINSFRTAYYVQWGC